MWQHSVRTRISLRTENLIHKCCESSLRKKWASSTINGYSAHNSSLRPICSLSIAIDIFCIRFHLILPIGGSQCDSYPCGTRKCTNIALHSYACELLSGHMTCGFEQWDTQCSAMLNITVGGDDYDPIYNTGERIYLQYRYAQLLHKCI